MASSATTVQFKALVRTASGGADHRVLMLPQEVSDTLSSRGLVAVAGRVDGNDLLTVAWPDGQGGHWIKVSPHLGGEVQVELAQSKVWPEPDVPADVSEALGESPAALELWNAINAATRTDWLYWLDSAKKAETRVKRIASMCDMLSKGKKKVCCFDRSGIYSKSIDCPVADSS